MSGAPPDIEGEIVGVTSRRSLMLPGTPRGGASLKLVSDPEEIVADATRAATALMRVIDAKPQKVMFNNELYFELEDWVLLGEFYGVAVMCPPESTKRVQFEDEDENGNVKLVRGWEASAIVIDKRSGMTVGGATAMCLNDEDKWSTRPKYEWMDVPEAEKRSIPEARWTQRSKSKYEGQPDRVRVKIADEPVPDFQRRSMAQTRAASKALSLRLRHVPVLASKSGRRVASTPAEEFHKEAPPPDKAPPTSPPIDADSVELIGVTLKAAHPDQKQAFADWMVAHKYTNDLGRDKKPIKGSGWKHFTEKATQADAAELLRMLGLDIPEPSAESSGTFDPDEVEAPAEPKK